MTATTLVELWRQTPCDLGGVGAGRRAWKSRYGDPGRRWVLHWCNRNRCKEYRHLYLGTRSQNERDKQLADPTVPRESHPTYVVDIAAKPFRPAAGPTLAAAISLGKAKARQKLGLKVTPKCKACGKWLRPKLQHVLTKNGDRYHRRCPVPVNLHPTAKLQIGWD